MQAKDELMFQSSGSWVPRVCPDPGMAGIVFVAFCQGCLRSMSEVLGYFRCQLSLRSGNGCCLIGRDDGIPYILSGAIILRQSGECRIDFELA